MPGPDGLEVLRTVREGRPAAELPIIMATARDDSEDVVEALQAGANDYVTKPFDFPVVLARVQAQCSLKRSVDRIRSLEHRLAQRNSELEAANAELARANQVMLDDLQAAARVQAALLPHSLPTTPDAAFAWRYLPCAELGGDLLNIVAVDDQHIALYVLDVVGHGVKAALLAVMANRELTRLLAGPATALAPGAVADHLNRQFPWDERTQQFFTLLYGVLRPDRGEFRFVSAGHPPPLHLPRAGEPAFCPTRSRPIGLGEMPYRAGIIHLEPGDRLCLYSDGIVEAMNPQGEPWGEERFARLLHAPSRGLDESLDRLLSELQSWSGPAPHDDISVLVAQRT
jgi:sigma-B regulation protein RsbU (phosphoserine phosphatase)